MKEKFNESSSNSKRNINIDIIKSNNFNDKLNISKKSKLIKYLYLILIIIIIIILVIFLCLYLLKIYKKYKSSIKGKKDLNCEDGLFIPEDDKTNCIKCSMKNCSQCIGSTLDNNCIKCNSGLNPIYENNKIISCSICEKGYYLINDECRLNYTFKAIYKSDGEEIKLINTNVSEIKQMIVDGEKVKPSINYLFNDTQYHEVIMLLDISKYIRTAFNMIEKMTSISFNPFFHTSNIVDMSSMFYYCPSLISVDFANLDTSKVTKMDFMFYYCSSLKSINLSNFNTSKLTNICGMFSFCSSLTSINLSNFNTPNLNDMGLCFMNALP